MSLSCDGLRVSASFVCSQLPILEVTFEKSLHLLRLLRDRSLHDRHLQLHFGLLAPDPRFRHHPPLIAVIKLFSTIAIAVPALTIVVQPIRLED